MCIYHVAFARVLVSNTHQLSQPYTYPYPTTSLPSTIKPEVLEPIIRMARRIAADPGNKVLDPPRFYCDSKLCQFCHSDILGQMYACLKRVHQLYSELSASHDYRHGVHTHD